MADSQYFKDRYHPRYHGTSVPTTDIVILATVLMSVVVFGLIGWANFTRVDAAKAEVQKVCYAAGYRA